MNVLPLILPVTLAYTENSAMATAMTQFDRAYKKLSSGACYNFLNQIDVDIK